ncbi:hypothetical protein EGC69_14510 [Escherichia coli]|nr:hypothetical protein BXO92_19825 [Escherichia coli]EFA4840620.1 hypothetical protein [Escherichia coli]EFN7667829.1 hypothetical protein [Escherichia coli]EGD7795005.1 hypothetical protein [Escherichia coli]EGO7536306.1 hypothetical protein [Escherichia coli]
MIFNNKYYFTVFLLAKINFIQPFDFIDVLFYFGEKFSLPFISKLQVCILLTSQYMLGLASHCETLCVSVLFLFFIQKNTAIED